MSCVRCYQGNGGHETDSLKLYFLKINLKVEGVHQTTDRTTATVESIIADLLRKLKLTRVVKLTLQVKRTQELKLILKADFNISIYIY